MPGPLRLNRTGGVGSDRRIARCEEIGSRVSLPPSQLSVRKHTITDKWQTSPSEGKVTIDWVTTGGEAKGWIDTHGMADLGLPEPEVRDCPAFLGEPAARILRAVCDYMLDSGTAVKAGETMGISDRTKFRFVNRASLAAHPPAPGLN